MRTTSYFGAVLLATLCIEPVTAQSQSADDAAPAAPGTYELTLGDSGRRYTLVIPAGYSAREGVPLIMSLHFGGEVTPFYGRGLVETLVGPALGDLGGIIVAPDNVTGGWANPQAQQHVLDLLDHIEASYNVDSERTLLTGYSMGGMGTWYLTPRLGDRFSAAIPMAGAPQPDSTELDWRTPTHVINGSDDELIPLEPARDAVEQLRAKGAPIELTVVDEITHFQMALYQPHLEAAVPWIREAWSR